MKFWLAIQTAILVDKRLTFLKLVHERVDEAAWQFNTLQLTEVVARDESGS
jgi:hypothetical protein